MTGSFEHIADWWDEKAGDEGDFYEQHLILTASLGGSPLLSRAFIAR
jgi:hypothetical protein